MSKYCKQPNEVGLVLFVSISLACTHLPPPLLLWRKDKRAIFGNALLPMVVDHTCEVILWHSGQYRRRILAFSGAPGPFPGA